MGSPSSANSRIRTVAFILPSLAGGGAERVMLTFAAGLDRARFRVNLILLTDDGPLSPLVAPDIEVTVLRKPRLRSALPAVRAALMRIRPDFAIATMGYLNMGLLGLRPVLPRSLHYVVREANAPSATLGSGLKAGCYRQGYRRLYRFAHRVVAPAKFIARDLQALGVPPDRLSVIYNPVDVDGLRDRCGTPARVPGPGRRFVAAGRLTEQKGFDRLIELATGLNSGDHISVFGDGPLRAQLTDRAQEVGVDDKIWFEGYSDQLPSRIAGAEALLLPSRWEGMPNVALEALALGTPVVSTPDAGGIGEIQSLAAPSAVTLAEAGEAFLAATLSIRPEPIKTVRPSMLPAAFSLARATADLEAILAV